MKAYLSVCAIYKDEGPYLREWIEFHRLVGVERFFLYDHASEDAHEEALAPYLGDGVVLHDWPIDPGQLEAYNHCLEAHGEESRWIAFIDLDEFLFSPTGRPLPEVLPDYENWPGVAVNRATYGTSGHRVMPEGLVIESYVTRALDDYFHNRMVKSIVDPARVERPRLHRFLYSEGFAVNENGQRVDDDVTETTSFTKLRINHYYSRSDEEFRKKFARVRASDGLPKRPPERPPNFAKMDSVLNHVRDEILLSYSPLVRQALHGVEQRDRGAVPGPELRPSGPAGGGGDQGANRRPLRDRRLWDLLRLRRWRKLGRSG